MPTTEMPTTESTVSRRALLGGGLAGAATVALAACGADPPDAVAAGDLLAVRVDRVPDAPEDGAWAWSPDKVVIMGPQQIALPNRATPAVPEITVRALHDGERIGFRLAWADAGTEDLTVRVDDFRDACAVLLAPGEGDEALRTMGSQTQPAVLLHWKADWERDLRDGVQGMAEVFPNRSVDTYPPLGRTTDPAKVTAADYEEAGATEWLPGLHVANPISSPRRATAVEKLVAFGFGTATTAGVQDANGRGERDGAGWRVVITKPLAATADGEQQLAAGGSATCAFAIWSGADDDAGGRKTPSATVYRLVLAP
jgi:hypothetical protein